VFQVINNQYGMGTSVAMASAETELWKRAAAYEMHGERVDGNDVEAVFESTTRLIALARHDRRPSLVETLTYRFRGHSVADAGKVYRTPEEIASWKARDPIDLFAGRAIEAGVLSEEDVTAVRREVEELVNSAIKEAAAAPAPEVAGLYEHVYRDGDTPEQFSRMDTAAPFGERKETRGWRT
jgi:pyruvate dehydrogenase E1 component alpha subunit